MLPLRRPTKDDGSQRRMTLASDGATIYSWSAGSCKSASLAPVQLSRGMVTW